MDKKVIKIARDNLSKALVHDKYKKYIDTRTKKFISRIFIICTVTLVYIFSLLHILTSDFKMTNASYLTGFCLAIVGVISFILCFFGIFYICTFISWAFSDVSN